MEAGLTWKKLEANSPQQEVDLTLPVLSLVRLSRLIINL